MDESEIIYADWKKVSEEAGRYHPGRGLVLVRRTLRPAVAAEIHRDHRQATRLGVCGVKKEILERLGRRRGRRRGN